VTPRMRAAPAVFGWAHDPASILSEVVRGEDRLSEPIMLEHR
jgi:hypothetical protein